MPERFTSQRKAPAGENRIVLTNRAAGHRVVLRGRLERAWHSNLCVFRFENLQLQPR